MVLACGAEETYSGITKRMGLTSMTAGKWGKGYREVGPIEVKSLQKDHPTGKFSTATS